MESISGIYEIRNTVNGHRYVGSSFDVNSRWGKHKTTLQKEIHHNQYLQRAWLYYGQSNFVFCVLEQCESSSLIQREQYYIDILRPEYNILQIAGSSLGTKLTKETREKMSKAHKGKTHDYMKDYPNPFFGKTHTAETRAKMSTAAQKRKVSPESRAKISERMKGNKHSLGNNVSKEVKNKISLSMQSFWKNKKQKEG
jgi:group I intron endonuclease